jgi:hypothetical protein
MSTITNTGENPIWVFSMRRNKKESKIEVFVTPDGEYEIVLDGKLEGTFDNQSAARYYVMEEWSYYDLRREYESELPAVERSVELDNLLRAAHAFGKRFHVDVVLDTPYVKHLISGNNHRVFKTDFVDDEYRRRPTCDPVFVDGDLD